MQPHETIWDLTNAAVAARALHVVAALRVADHVGDVPTPAKDLAAACGADADALDRVLRLLAAHGVFAVADTGAGDGDGDGGFVHTEPSRLLRSDHPMSMRAFAHMMDLPGVLACLNRLGHSVRTGQAAAEVVHPGGFWGYLQANPDDARVFGEAMTAKAVADVAGVLDAYDFGRFATVADIGGGRGHLLRAILDSAPAARGVLFDLPPVVDAFELGRERLDTHPGDFFVDPLPAADAYVLMEVIHDWPDREAVAILTAVRRAAAPGARVLVVENVIDEGADRRGRVLDTIMLALTGGRERTAAQLGALLGAAGFGAPAVIRTRGPLSLVEAVAV